MEKRINENTEIRTQKVISLKENIIFDLINYLTDYKNNSNNKIREIIIEIQLLTI